MAGLVPAIHVFGAPKKDVDARDKRGHDDRGRSLAMTVRVRRYPQPAAMPPSTVKITPEV
jgi:hypothetical protein